MGNPAAAAPLASKLKVSVHAVLGRTLEYTYEVREIDPGRRLVMAAAQGPFPMETTYRGRTWRPGRQR